MRSGRSDSDSINGNVVIFLSLILVSSFYLAFSVPPIIEPFSFQDGLAEGMRTRTVCGVSSGDAPLTLRWLKDGEPVPLLLGANISTFDQYSSLLSIPSLSASHSGDYTCVASNPAAENKYTATLQVKGRVSQCPARSHQLYIPSHPVCALSLSLFAPPKSPTYSFL